MKCTYQFDSFKNHSWVADGEQRTETTYIPGKYFNYRACIKLQRVPGYSLPEYNVFTILRGWLKLYASWMTLPSWRVPTWMYRWSRINKKTTNCQWHHRCIGHTLLPTRMWHYCIREWMPPHISIGIRRLWRAKSKRLMDWMWYILVQLHLQNSLYSQGKPHNIAKCWVAILAVIQQSYAKAMFREVSPFVATHLRTTMGHGRLPLGCKKLQTSNFAWSQEVLKWVGLDRWPNWISYLASQECTLTGNSTFRNLWRSCQFT